MMDKLNATMIIISLICSEKENDIGYLYTLLKFGILLLYGGNLNVQKTLHNYFITDLSSEKFFEKMHNLIMREISKNEMPESAKHIEDEKENKLFTMKILRFLQLFCEGHNIFLQNYLRNQIRSKNNYDLVSLIVKLLNSFKVGSENYKNVLQCFDTLTELIQVIFKLKFYTLSIHMFRRVFRFVQMSVKQMTIIKFR